MSLRRLENPILVYNKAMFTQMLEHLSAHEVLALDTESDSLYRYRTRVCLLQLTTYADPVSENADGENVVDYLVDPLRYDDLSGLSSILADPAHEVVMHAAENDMLLLQREYDFDFARIFDTQLAARILGWRRVGLAAILEEQFGIATNKQLQRTNWGQRPLTPEQIAYAQVDTHYLPALRRQQIERLQAAGRWEEAQEAFRFLAQTDYRDRLEPERTFWQIKEAREIDREYTAVLEALWQWREAEAERRDCPPFKVIRNHVLGKLAVFQPGNYAELVDTPGLSEREAKRYGNQLLAVIAAGRGRPLPEMPEAESRIEPDLDHETIARFDALRRWRSKTAQARGVQPDIVFTNDILMEIAKQQPQSIHELRTLPMIGAWKARTYGPALLEVMDGLRLH